MIETENSDAGRIAVSRVEEQLNSRIFSNFDALVQPALRMEVEDRQ